MSGGFGRVSEVLDGIEHASDAGLDPIKINAVIQRGVNDTRRARSGRTLPRHAA